MEKAGDFYLGKYQILFGDTSAENKEVVIIYVDEYHEGILEMLGTFPKTKQVIIFVREVGIGEVTSLKAGYIILHETEYHRVVTNRTELSQKDRVIDLIRKFSFYHPEEDPIVGPLDDIDSVGDLPKLWFDRDIVKYPSVVDIGIKEPDVITLTSEFSLDEVSMDYFKKKWKAYDEYIRKRIIELLAAQILEMYTELVNHSEKVEEHGHFFRGSIKIVKPTK